VTPEEMVGAMRRWRGDPEAFVREVLQVEVIDAWQLKALRALKANNLVAFRIALKACKGPGKSTVLSWIGLWFLATRKHPKCVAISITKDNLRDNLWAEFSKWMSRSELLKQHFTWTKERIFNNRHPETWWISARSFAKEADATQQASALAGVHADHVLFLIDEAGSIPVAVVATAEAGLANAGQEGREALLVMAGNPETLEGALYWATVKNRAKWFVISISSAPKDPDRTPRVSKQWAQDQIDAFGWDSAFVLINVRGEFPPASPDALLGVEDVEKAVKRSATLLPQHYEDYPTILGVDVARFGDDATVILRRRGPAVFRPRILRGLRTTEVTGQVAAVINRRTPDAVFVDAGTMGAGVVDQLLELGHSVIGVEFGSGADDGKVYADKRAEMWWQMAQHVKGSACLPNVAEFISELPAPKYFFDSKGRIRIESKDDMKARGIPSPNVADAYALTFAHPVASKAAREQLAGAANRVAEHEYNPFA
jgi:phage terminase large subunit